MSKFVPFFNISLYLNIEFIFVMFMYQLQINYIFVYTIYPAAS
jgi:hypothetical protein